MEYASTKTCHLNKRLPTTTERTISTEKCSNDTQTYWRFLSVARMEGGMKRPLLSQVLDNKRLEKPHLTTGLSYWDFFFIPVV
ncbi:hypothetical protein TNCV_4653651 [Trichonephila clavipes]|nr:hypothetical protein TNCV_4653651 [Trichonephila clavipes]